MSQAPSVIANLVARFERNIDAYRKQGYNETQLRREFLDPFFEALEWDVSNREGHAEAYKDVIHEDAIKIGGATKAPDYCFRIGGTRKFFLEAKKPSVNLKDEPAPAYQLRRYAWSAKLPLSILTDFEEFAVYDCRIRPKDTDKPGVGRVHYWTYQQYIEKWDDIAGIFSKDAVLKGSFDKYAITDRKRGTATVDAEFLAEIEQWRAGLAKNLANRNPRLTVHELNFTVQRTIDRLIFLRICEDRGVEAYGQLQALLNGSHVYQRLQYLYEQADDRYNSGLFHFRSERDRAETPDDLTLRVKIDDTTLKEILTRLYYPQSPYEFSVFPVEILGQVYEQFLGKVIRLTSGHQAKIEEKPEVKKAGGVYYTPAYIVDYVVTHTVGTLCEGKTPKQISKFRILDPACGSGSFLIGAYNYLVMYHRDWYVNDGPEHHRKELYQAVSGEWRLTTQEKKRILLNNIYGVDIDSQAVEVTKLSLLLKVLEGESDETLKRQLSFVKERALPDLGRNIKCGNSLIGPDYFSGQLLPDEDEMRRVNPFDWKSEFPEIIRTGGFDAVIGNPPYVRQEALSNFKDYLSSRYEAFDGVADLYTYFMERSVHLLREDGRFSCIVSSSFLRAAYGEPLRRTLKKYAAVLNIVDFGGLPVFENAKDTYVCIPLLAKTKQSERVVVSHIPSLTFVTLDDYVAKTQFSIRHQRLSSEAWSLKSDNEANAFEKIMQIGKPLGDYVNGHIRYGIKTGLNEAFIIDSKTRKTLIAKDKSSSELIKPLLGGEDVRRYFFNRTDLWLIFTRRGLDISRYPAIRDHLLKWKAQLVPKRSSKDKVGRKPGSYAWYEIQDDVAYFKAFDHPKIIYPDIAKGPRFTLDTEGHYLANTAYCLSTDDRYLLGILNSQLFWFAISNISIPFGIRAGQYRYRLIYQYMEKVPIRVIDFSTKEDKARHDQMIALVERMLEFHKRLSDSNVPANKDHLQRQITATNQHIDRLVYDLYGLTEDEIRIVKQASIASSNQVKENKEYGEEIEPADRPRTGQRTLAAVARETQYAGEGGSGASESATGARERIHGIREPAGEYRPSQDPPNGPEGQSELGSTRYFDTAEGRLSYADLAERLAIPLVAIHDEILQNHPDQIIITSEWLCARHKRLAGHLFPDWAGRFRDVNVQVGAHTPPPFYEVPIHTRQFCEDLSVRLHHIAGNLDELADFFAWVDWRLQWIHPFRDFNGRIGRVLSAALLYRLGLPYAQLAPTDPEARQEYLSALHAADGGNSVLLSDVWHRRILEAL